MTENSRESELPKSIEFEYIRKDDTPIVYATGIWGGTTPRGSILMAFFNEHQRVPVSEEYSIGPDGRLGERTGEPDKRIARYIGVEVVLDLDTAQSVRRWLDDKIALLEKAQAAMRDSVPTPRRNRGRR